MNAKQLATPFRMHTPFLFLHVPPFSLIVRPFAHNSKIMYMYLSHECWFESSQTDLSSVQLDQTDLPYIAVRIAQWVGGSVFVDACMRAVAFCGPSTCTPQPRYFTNVAMLILVFLLFLFTMHQRVVQEPISK